MQSFFRIDIFFDTVNSSATVNNFLQPKYMLQFFFLQPNYRPQKQILLCKL